MDNGEINTSNIGQELQIDQTANGSQEEGGKQRKRSPRKYPYYSLKTAIEVAQVVYEKRGGITTKIGLAESLGIPKGSSLEMKVISAANFGLLERKEGEIRTTDLARKIIKPIAESEKQEALGEAFASVPLFESIQRRFAGRPLPEKEGIKNLFEREYDITKESLNEAYNMMVASAKEAGLLKTSEAGLWLTIFPEQKTSEEKKEASETLSQQPSSSLQSTQQQGSNDDYKTQLQMDSAMTGLLLKLPPNNRFKNKAERERWKKTFDALFKFLYHIEGEG